MVNRTEQPKREKQLIKILILVIILGTYIAIQQ